MTRCETGQIITTNGETQQTQKQNIKNYGTHFSGHGDCDVWGTAAAVAVETPGGRRLASPRYTLTRTLIDDQAPARSPGQRPQTGTVETG